MKTGRCAYTAPGGLARGRPELPAQHRPPIGSPRSRPVRACPRTSPGGAPRFQAEGDAPELGVKDARRCDEDEDAFGEVPATGETR